MCFGNFKVMENNNEQKPIILAKSSQLVRFFILVADALNKASATKEIIVEDQKLYQKDKNPEDILVFDFDYKTVIDKYLFDFREMHLKTNGN